MMKIKLKIIFGPFSECFILVDYYFLHFERYCVHAVNDFYILRTIPHFVDNSTFCGQFQICGQFHILRTGQYFVPRKTEEGPMGDKWGLMGNEGGREGTEGGPRGQWRD